MAGEIRISREEFEKQGAVWKQSEEDISPEIYVLEPYGELEVLNKYLEFYGELSLLLEEYVELLEEDRGRILGAVEEMLTADANLLKES